jgi:hypothetical protein
VRQFSASKDVTRGLVCLVMIYGEHRKHNSYLELRTVIAQQMQ